MLFVLTVKNETEEEESTTWPPAAQVCASQCLIDVDGYRTVFCNQTHSWILSSSMTRWVLEKYDYQMMTDNDLMTDRCLTAQIANQINLPTSVRQTVCHTIYYLSPIWPIPNIMVKRSCYGKCNSGARYAERLVNGVLFVPFLKPFISRIQCDKCLQKGESLCSWSVCWGCWKYWFTLDVFTWNCVNISHLWSLTCLQSFDTLTHKFHV